MMLHQIKMLARDARGSAIIEFALLAPVMFGMIFGVIQIGMSMQSYNALRSISAETARYALVKYMKKEEISNIEIQDEAEDIANGAPYLMRDDFVATVTDVATSRVKGAHEKTLTVAYTPPTILPFFGFASSELRFTRPIFLIDE